jgi:hypothetical protein
MSKHVTPGWEGKIISARETVRWGDCTVYAIVDGAEQRLFSYYIDEVSIDPRELIGLTPAEALDLKRQRDINYLRS